MFNNIYHCPACNFDWSAEWSAQVDDDCPKCGTNCSPSESEDRPEAQAIGDVLAKALDVKHDWELIACHDGVILKQTLRGLTMDEADVAAFALCRKEFRIDADIKDEDFAGELDGFQVEQLTKNSDDVIYTPAGIDRLLGFADQFLDNWEADEGLEDGERAYLSTVKVEWTLAREFILASVEASQGLVPAQWRALAGRPAAGDLEHPVARLCDAAADVVSHASADIYTDADEAQTAVTALGQSLKTLRQRADLVRLLDTPEPPMVHVHMYGGLIQWSMADKPVQLIVTDGDVEGVYHEDLTDVPFVQRDNQIENESVVARIETPELNPTYVGMVADAIQGANK